MPWMLTGMRRLWRQNLHLSLHLAHTAPRTPPAPSTSGGSRRQPEATSSRYAGMRMNTFLMLSGDPSLLDDAAMGHTRVVPASGIATAVQAAGESGGVPANLASTDAAASSNSAAGAGCATQRRVSATSSIGGMLPDELSDTQPSVAEAEGVDELSAATISTAAADRPAAKMGQAGAASKAHQPPVPAGPASKKTGMAGAVSAAAAGGARERRLSSSNAVDTEETDTAHADNAAAKPPAAAGAVAPAGRKAGVAAGKPRRTKQSDAGVSAGGAAPAAAPSRRATGGGAAASAPSVVPEDSSAVPGLRLGGRTTSSDDAGEEAGQDGLNRRMIVSWQHLQGTACASIFCLDAWCSGFLHAAATQFCATG